MEIEVILLGRMSYDLALQIQKKIHMEVLQNKRKDTLLLVEHVHVFTMGRRTESKNLLHSPKFLNQKGIGIHKIGRGGDITYHGQGQIVGYPIVNLKRINKKTRTYVESMEDVFIRLLRDNFDIDANKDTGKYTGVWVGDRKITAIGVEIKRYVTMHGFAFNVNTDLKYFDWIVPCGLDDRGVTSLEVLTGKRQNMDQLFQMVAKYFCEVFELVPTFRELKDTLEDIE